MNTFTYANYTFDDSVIVSAEIATEQSLLSEHLSADTLRLVIRSDDTGDAKVYTVLMEWYTTVNDEGYVVRSGNLAEFTYGTPILYYRDGVFYGKFYVTQIERVGEDLFQINAVSALGLMAYMTHKGGVYPTASITNAKQLIDDIMVGTGFPYSVGDGISNVSIQGFLPYADKMSNLQQVLFAIGASLVKDSSGNLSFIFNNPASATPIGSDRIKEGGGGNIYIAPATRISLTEHLYYQSPISQAEEIYSYSGVSANNELVLLSEPVVPSSITGNGITINESGANYFVFSGTGTVTAIKYTHLQTERSWTAATVNGEENEITISNATLVNGNNSVNVLNRLVKYYTQRKQSDLNFYVTTEKTGSYVSFDDVFGDEKSGFVSKLTLNLSKEVGGRAEVTTDWYPSDQGNTFNAYQLLQTATTYYAGTHYPATAVGKAARFVLIGGFRGGQGGTAGENGEDTHDQVEESAGFRAAAGEGGKHGGRGGIGGVGCMVYSVDVASLPSAFTINAIGVGGAGGAAGAYGLQGTMGSLGGNTEITVNNVFYSSNSGVENTSGFINTIDGTFYNIQGTHGFDNDTGVGGKGAQSESGEQGGSFTANGTTWKGGKVGKYYSGSGWSSSQPGGGGGAAYGRDGWDGGNGGGSGSHAGAGGAGATPSPPSQASFPYGGNGGHGGGAGGGAGGYWNNKQAMGTFYKGTGGVGGAGSVGGQGANGAVIFYYGS